MGKSKPPPPPDYTALALQQGNANKEAGLEAWKLNNSPLKTPWGTRQLIADPTSPSGYRIEEGLDDLDLQNLNQSRQLQGQLLGLAPSMIDTLKKTLSSGMDVSNMPAMVSGVDAGGLEKLKFNIPQAQYGFQRGQIQGDVDFSGLSPLESGNAVRDRVEQAGMDKYMRRMQPRFDRQEDALNTRLANMGGNTSSRAARLQRQELSQNQEDAMTNAQFDSVLRGGEEAQRQFGMGLQGRQQDVSEIMGKAGFRNQAQQQDFGQLSELANLWNSARGQDASLQETMAGFNNQTVQQNIQNAFQNASLQNAARAAGITEMAQLRQMPLNEIMAILSGTQINSPQFQGAAPTNGWEAAPFYRAGQDTYNARVANTNAKNANISNAFGTAIKAAGLFAMSDRRLKSNIVRVGETPGGTPVYEYDLFGERTRGVMADEVPEEARALHPSGYWMVDYAKVR